MPSADGANRVPSRSIAADASARRAASSAASSRSAGRSTPTPAFRAATSGERGIRLVDGVQRGLAEVDDARAPRPALGRRVGDGVVEPLLQEERLVQPYPGGLERVAHVACGRRAELGVGERHLAFRLAHGRVGLHDQALGADLEGAAVVERDTLAPRAEAPEADDAARDRHGCGTEDEEGWQPPETFGHEPESRTCRCVVAGRRLGARIRPGSDTPRAVNPPCSVACGIRASYSRHMRVLLKLTLDCTPDAAWRALRSPAVLREVVAPWLDFSSLEDGGLPTTWPEGVHRVRALAFRRFPAGDELVDVSYPGGLPTGVRMLRDGGGALTGPLAVFDRWDHRMAVSELPDGRTLYRDQLLAHAGAIDLLAWYPTWAFWQWRGMRLRQLAPGWAYDPPGTADADAADAARAAATPVGVVA